MVNLNTHLPSSVAAAFHPPTETLHRDNLIKPIIPKTEIISSYAKLHDHEKSSQFSDQSHHIIHDKGEQITEQTSPQEYSSKRRRSQFFARRGKSFASAADSGNTQVIAIEDFKQVVSVIMARYSNAVMPFPEPTISYAI